MDQEQLEAFVRAAFAGVPMPAPDDIVPHPCDECLDLRDALAGRTWQELGEDFLATHLWDLPLLSDEAKRYYLPVWLLPAALDLEAVTTEPLLYALESDHRWEPPGGYSDEQRAAIVAWLHAFIEHASDFDLPFVERALQRWDPDWS